MAVQTPTDTREVRLRGTIHLNDDPRLLETNAHKTVQSRVCSMLRVDYNTQLTVHGGARTTVHWPQLKSETEILAAHTPNSHITKLSTANLQRAMCQ